MACYKVTFKETYEYTKFIETDDNEDINEIIRDPLQCPRVVDMTNDDYQELNGTCVNEYNVDEV